jgi:5'(3')-deoxyribonucleotidase
MIAISLQSGLNNLLIEPQNSDSSMKTILLDCDGVILDLAGTLHKFVNKMLGRKVPPPESWKCYEFKDAMELTRSEWEFVSKMLTRKDRIGYQIPFYSSAQSFIEHLGFDNRVVFTTAPWRGLDHWVEARYSVLDHFLGRRNYSIVLTHEKDLISGDWLIDDKWENMEKTPERGILFARPWNVKFNNFAAFVAGNYTDVLAILDGQVDDTSTIAKIEPRGKEKPAQKTVAKAKRH